MKPFLNNLLNIFHFRRQTAFFAVLGAVFIIYGVFIVSNHASAEWTVEGIVKTALGAIFGLLFYLLGGILSVILEILVSVAQYNNIIGLEVVKNTWGTVRDIVNMFFIFAMLLIAFSTILRIHQYEAKQLLPKLILYAVLVNFSLTICGLFIDIAQVFTLTFVNAFGENAVSNFTNITGILQYDKVDFGDAGKAALNVLVGYILALILLLVSIVIIGAFVLIFLVRIVYLWILSILSPFAFVLPIIPGGQSYASQWWTMFSKQVVTAPLLAFFIWLSLTVLGGMGSISNQILNKQQADKISGEVNLEKTVMIGGSEIGTGEFLIGFIISIGMLFVGLMLTSQMSGAASKILGGATDVLKGKLGPTPMRWARERYGSWRGQRESIRKEKVSRFGQGASALQDWAINKNVGHALIQIYKAPAGAIGRGVGRYAKQVHSGLGGSEKSMIGRGLKTTSEWRPGQKDRWRAMERVEKYKGKKTSEDINTFTTAERLDLIDNPATIRERARKETNEMQQTAYALRLGEMRNLGEYMNKEKGFEDVDFEEIEIKKAQPARTEMRDKHDVHGVKIGQEEVVVEPAQKREVELVRKKEKGYISKTSDFLDRAPEMKQKFDDLMKKSNQKAAMLSSIYQRDSSSRNPLIEKEEHISDAKQGKIDLSAIDESMVKMLDASAGGQAGSYFNELAGAIRDTKEMVRIFGSLNKDVRTKYMDQVKLADLGLSNDMKIAFGEATGHFKEVFMKSEIDSDGNKREILDEDMAREFFSRAENKDLFVKGYGTKFENKDLVKFLHDNWLELEFTGSQWDRMFEDPKSRDSIKKIAHDLLSKINKDSASYNTDYAKDNGYGYGKNRLRNTLAQFFKSDTYEYTDENGQKQKAEIYGLHHENPEIAEASQKAFLNQVKQGRLRAEKLENANVWEDEINEKGFNKPLLEVLAAFNSDGIAKLSIESRKRGEKVIEYMIKNYERYQGTVDRLLSNNALVHMMSETTKEGTTLRELYGEEKAKKEKKINAKKEEEEEGEKAKKEAKEKKKKEEEEGPKIVDQYGKPYKK